MDSISILIIIICVLYIVGNDVSEGGRELAPTPKLLG